MIRDTYYYLPLYFKRDMLIRFQDIEHVSTLAMENCVTINGEYLEELEKRSDFNFMLHKIQYLTEIKKILKENTIFASIKRKIKSYFENINEEHLLTQKEKNALVFMFFHVKFNKEINRTTFSIINHFLKSNKLSERTRELFFNLREDYRKIKINPEKTRFLQKVKELYN